MIGVFCIDALVLVALSLALVGTRPGRGRGVIPDGVTTTALAVGLLMAVAASAVD